jgi:multidrug efflux pump subunit AcrA (membrane-fusion protein)
MKESSQRDWDHQIRLAAQCDVLAKIDPRLFQAAFDQAQAKKAQDEAQLIAAEKDLVRSKTLAQKDYGSQQQVDLNQAKVDQLKASIAADVAAIETAQTQLDYTSITAPSDGRVGIRLVDPGNIVHASACAARRRKLSLFRSWRMTAIPALIDRSAIEGQSASLHRGADSEAGVRGLELRCAERKFISRGLSHTWIYSERSPCRRYIKSKFFPLHIAVRVLSPQGQSQEAVDA